MKPRHITIVVAVGFIAFAVWWFMQPIPIGVAQSPAIAAASSPKPRTAVSPMAPLPQQSSQMPVVVNLGVSSSLQESAQSPKLDSLPQTEASSPVNDPRSDLKTAIPELMNLIEAQDWTGLLNEFTPEASKINRPDGDPLEQKVQRMNDWARQNPNDYSRHTAEWLTALQIAKNQTPNIVNQGGAPTYVITNDKGQVMLTFVKLNGLWYIGVMN